MSVKSIKKVEAVQPLTNDNLLQFDPGTTARVVESMVLRGDISALNPEERARFYVQMCEALGLTAATQPFAILRLNGKEVMYPTRGATDQLAAIHRLNREIVDGPKVVDVAGTKMIYAVCKATHPNGRVETAVATVPLADPINALMKCETKAKRRATLSILGLGMLDETEIETIPAHIRGSHMEVPLLGDGVANDNGPTQEELPSASPAELPAAMQAFHVDLEQIELPSESVSIWVKHRAEIAELAPPFREAAWKALCARTESVGRMKNARVWLKRAIAEDDNRRATATSPEPTASDENES
ncbi:MAG: hypothetical protein Q8Q09_29575 [Deltaproteobacteria bacterium]|nr:hypothetical protein [Deltaproteobacteria bacterium]